MRKFLLICTICFSIPLMGQINLNYLFTVWNDPTQADSNRLAAIHSIARDGYLYSQPESSYYYAQLHYDYAQSRGNLKEMALSLNTQGISFWLRSDLDTALVYFLNSQAISEELGDQ